MKQMMNVSHFTNLSDSKQRLAWHETMELHELVAMQSNQLIQLKRAIHNISDPQLHSLYREAITGISSNLQELLGFYSYPPAPVRNDWNDRADDAGFYAGCLLGIAKSAVKNYAAALTETASPFLRRIFEKQLIQAIALHYKIFLYMYHHGYYPSYNLEQLRENDLRNAEKALAFQG